MKVDEDGIVIEFGINPFKLIRDRRKEGTRFWDTRILGWISNFILVVSIIVFLTNIKYAVGNPDISRLLMIQENGEYILKFSLGKTLNYAWKPLCISILAYLSLRYLWLMLLCQHNECRVDEHWHYEGGTVYTYTYTMEFTDYPGTRCITVDFTNIEAVLYSEEFNCLRFMGKFPIELTGFEDIEDGTVEELDHFDLTDYFDPSVRELISANTRYIGDNTKDEETEDAGEKDEENQEQKVIQDEEKD